MAICDVGANIACKPINLYQYGLMASVYSEVMLGVAHPRLGLMSIGEEDAKGNEIVKRVREMLKSDPRLNFIGNIEGRDIFRGVCDVVVCEGFVGNVILNLETSDELAGFYGEQEIMKGKAFPPGRLIERLRKVTAEEVRSVARTIFKDEKLNLAAIGPYKNRDHFGKILKL